MDRISWKGGVVLAAVCLLVIVWKLTMMAYSRYFVVYFIVFLEFSFRPCKDQKAVRILESPFLI
jgi:hypothetical protein